MAQLSRSQKIMAMKKSPLFSALDEVQLEQLLRVCVDRHFAVGRNIISPGQKADAFFVILAGKVKIFQVSPSGDEQILHLYGAGESFAEAAMWAGIPYPAQAQAIGDSTLLIVTHSTLLNTIEANPELAIGMLVGLSSKLREFNQLIERLSLRDVPARLAGWLVQESRRTGSSSFHLPQTKRQLASQLGTVAETLSRAFAKLKMQGLIDVKGSNITILNASAVESLSHGRPGNQ